MDGLLDSPLELRRNGSVAEGSPQCSDLLFSGKLPNENGSHHNVGIDAQRKLVEDVIEDGRQTIKRLKTFLASYNV